WCDGHVHSAALPAGWSGQGNPGRPAGAPARLGGQPRRQRVFHPGDLLRSRDDLRRHSWRRADGSVREPGLGRTTPSPNLMRAVAAVCLSMVLSAPPSFAQQTESPEARVNAQRDELARIRAERDELERKMSGLQN